MPKYNYLCLNCRQRSRLFFSYADYGQKPAICPHCRSQEMKRLIGRIALGKSEESRQDSFMNDPDLAQLDENDPKSLGTFMRKMSSEMGEDLGDEFNEVVDRLEKGESPEKIEESMPNLKDE